MDAHMSAGTHVVYKSGDHWQEGVVDSNSAEGVIMIRLVNQTFSSMIVISTIIIMACAVTYPVPFTVYSVCGRIMYVTFLVVPVRSLNLGILFWTVSGYIPIYLSHSVKA